MLVCFSIWMLNLDVFEFGTCSVLMRSNWKSVVVFDVSLFFNMAFALDSSGLACLH